MASGEGFEFTAQLWRHPGEDGWHFVTLPQELAGELRDLFAGAHRPFGSLAVEVTIGETTWTTSLFADSRSGSYLLPVKAAVRRAQRLDAGADIAVTIVPR